MSKSYSFSPPRRVLYYLIRNPWVESFKKKLPWTGLKRWRVIWRALPFL
jgi:hypothetical protein